MLFSPWCDNLISMKKPQVAAFDFDGTITYGDSLGWFCYDAVGPFRAVVVFATLAPALIRYLFGRSSRKILKEECLTTFFKGMPYDAFQKLADNFAHGLLRKKIKPDMREKIRQHKNQGDTLVLLSASIETYLIPWANEAGFDHILASRLEVVDGKVTGKLLGENCRGQEKVRRFNEIMGDRSSYELTAYGNSDGDKELLEYADQGIWV